MSPKTAEPPNLDAFVDVEADETDREAIRRIERATGASSGDIGEFVKVELMATLQDAKVSAATNGDNYDVTFQVDIEGFVRLAVETARGKGSYALVWNKLHVGNGGELKRFSGSRNADGEPQFRVVFHFPQSEIARSLGRLGTQLRTRAALVLEPEQGSLGLEDGTKVDLTKRADDDDDDEATLPE